MLTAPNTLCVSACAHAINPYRTAHKDIHAGGLQARRASDARGLTVETFCSVLRTQQRVLYYLCASHNASHDLFASWFMLKIDVIQIHVCQTVCDLFVFLIEICCMFTSFAEKYANTCRTL